MSFNSIENPPAIVEQVTVPRQQIVRQQIPELIKGMNTNTITLAELLYEAKSQEFFTKWGYNTFKDYLSSVDIKPARAYYLIKIIDVMKQSGVSHKDYADVDIMKLIAISKLDPKGVFQGQLMTNVIKHLVTNAETMAAEDVRKAVAQIQGVEPGEEVVWVNVPVKAAARDLVIKPALEAAKMAIGSVGKDDEGNSIDPSDGNALEKICADFLSDPVNNPLGGAMTDAQSN